MTVPSQHGDPCSPFLLEREKTIEVSLQTRQKLAELMDQIDETVIVLRTEIEHAKSRRGES
jgi:hypothetical protein